MIVADTSAILHFLHGFDSPAKLRVRSAFATEKLVLPPVVVTELISGPKPDPSLDRLLTRATTLDPRPGFWERAGLSRRRLLQRGLRARISDTLIAQAAIDEDAELISGDTDFRHFVDHCGLRLAA